MECIYGFPEGSHCTLKLDSFEAIGATVVWMRNRVAGCRFDRQLHPAIVDAIALRYPGLGLRAA